ncbi:MAG: HAD-IC family P-type ATPase, partial [Bacilli bacterium]|nr:HAD-IC family P-type ATPase [Bacilli bacterium]
MSQEKVTPEYPETDVSIGLSEEEAIKRRKEGFGNKSEVKVEKTVAKIICDNLFSVFSVVLYGIGILFAAFSLYLHSIGESELARTYFGISKYGFLGPLTISIVMGIVTEIRSKRVLDKLRLENQPTAEVLRDGTWKTIPSTDLVLGDVISLSPGFQCAGDITVIEGECEVDESFMTGEAEAVVKSPEESRNRIYSGSAVLSGRVKGIVREVGKNTYINQLSKKVKKIQKSKSGLMRSIYMILDFNAILLFIIVGTVLGTLIYKVTKWGSDPAVFGSVMTLDSFEAWAKIITTTSAFAIGVIPTGLVLMTSVALAASVVTLAKQETLIQELYSLENLSRVDTLCLDKTGTLTDGSMKLETAVYLDEEEKAKSALRYLLGSLSDFNPTSQALLEAFGKEEAVEYASLIPFSSARKYSGVVTKEGKEIVMGAPEILFSDHPEALAKAKTLASQGYRVIGLSLDKQPVSLFALKDGIRRSAKETIAFFVENHLDIKIISGDNPETVSSIAALCGVPNAEKAISLAGLSEDEVRKAASEYTVFARVSPEQKEILVSALQAKKHNVGMTGDGVNDILALRKANASITFHKATDAAKACADVVLLDDDFVHLKEVVGQGRKVVNNIERTAALFLMKTITIAL